MRDGDRDDLAWAKAISDPHFLNEKPEYRLIRMSELYDDCYGFVDHTNDPSPLSLIKLPEQEDPLALVGYKNYQLEYLRYDILNRFGLSFETWFHYPYAKRKSFVEAIEEHVKLFPDPSNELKKIQKEMEGLYKPQT